MDRETGFTEEVQELCERYDMSCDEEKNIRQSLLALADAQIDPVGSAYTEICQRRDAAVLRNHGRIHNFIEYCSFSDKYGNMRTKAGISQ